MSRTSSNQISSLGTIINGYDYKHQAWVINGRYSECGHPEAGSIIPARTDFYIANGQRHEMHVPARQAVDCNCYGRLHTGEICIVGTNGNVSDTAAKMSETELSNALAVEIMRVVKVEAPVL